MPEAHKHGYATKYKESKMDLTGNKDLFEMVFSRF
jgi:hypothetical protein